MSRSLYWKPHKPNEMQCLNKCIPLMNAIQNVFGSPSAILNEKHIGHLFWLASSVGEMDCEAINDLIQLINDHGEIEVEIVI